MGSSLSGNLDVLFTKMEDFISTKTVVGEAITVGDMVLLPLIEVSVGVGAGSSDSNEKNGKDSGMGGLGAKIIPSAVLAIHNGNVQLINIKNQDAVSKLIDMAPGVVSKLNFGSVFGKGSDSSKKEEPREEVKFEETTIVEE